MRCFFHLARRFWNQTCHTIIIYTSSFLLRSILSALLRYLMKIGIFPGKDHVEKNSKNYRSDENHKITHSHSLSHKLQILHYSNLTLFQFYIFPILHSSLHSFNHSLIHSYTLTLSQLSLHSFQFFKFDH